MPIPSPFHSRTAPLCESQEWRNWSGYLAAAVYEPGHEREYYAIRNAAALIDVSPLFKYEIRGPQAVTALNRILTRNITRCAIGQVMYSPWCDDNGKVIDDGTVARLSEQVFRLTAAEPNLAWFQDCSYRMEVEVLDVSDDLAALVEAYVAIGNGIKSKDLDDSRRSIKEKYGDRKIGGIDFGSIMEEF